MDRNAIHYRIRSCKVYIFKYTDLFLFFPAVFLPGSDSILTKDQDLSGFHIADELCSHRFECTAFGCDDIHAVFGFSIAERPEPIWVTCTDQFLRGKQDQRIGSFQNIHRPAESFFDRRGLQPFLCHDVCDRFRVRRGVENRAGKFQFAPQLCRIGQIAVMRDRHASFLMVHFDRLAVVPV